MATELGSRKSDGKVEAEFNAAEVLVMTGGSGDLESALLDVDEKPESRGDPLDWLGAGDEASTAILFLHISGKN